MPRTDGRWILPPLFLLFTLTVGAGFPAATAAAPEGRLDALRETLRRDREAHLERDAAKLASGLAESLVTVDDGRISWTTRSEVQRYFESYFRDATYHAWDDLEPPVIRLSEDGTMAWVSRRVTVDREEPAPDGRRRHFVSAWTSTYSYAGNDWQMTSVTSTFEASPAVADRILEGARRAAGWRDGSLPPALVAEADVAGPVDSFRVRVLSQLPDAGRIDWISGRSIAQRGDSAWTAGAGEPAKPASPAVRTMLVGHETHWNALRPERLGVVTYGGRARFGGQEALRLTVLNPVGAPIDLFYAAADTLPLGFRTGDHFRPERGGIEVRFADWRVVGEGRLFYAVTFTQDDEVFRYAYTRLQLSEGLDESEFEPPVRAGGESAR